MLEKYRIELQVLPSKNWSKNKTAICRMGTLARPAFGTLWCSSEYRTGKSAHPTVLFLDKFKEEITNGRCASRKRPTR